VKEFKRTIIFGSLFLAIVIIIFALNGCSSHISSTPPTTINNPPPVGSSPSPLGKTDRSSPTPTKPYYVLPTGGTVYYVSPAGNDGNDGSEVHPFATIQKAAEEATPGTVVHVLAGIYTQPVIVANSGTADARITFFSEVKWGAKIKTTGTQDPWITNADYIDVIGFDISSTGSRNGIENRGSFIRTIGNHVHDIPGGNCDSIGGSGIDDDNYQAHDDDIIGNLVDHIGATYPQMCEYVHAIYHSTARGHVLNNIVYDNAGCGINLWHAATATVVDNNLSFGNQEHGISVGTNTEDTNGVLGDDFIVANNISIDNARLGIRERIGVGTHNQYLNNIVYGNERAPFGDESYDWPPMTGSRAIDTITQDVQFMDFELDGSGDYHLQATSPAIGAGTSVGAPSTDFSGKPRSQGIDIGPYQYT
jgi:hypothetical protein